MTAPTAPTAPATVEATFPLGRTLRILAHRAQANKKGHAEHERGYLETLFAALKPGMIVYDVGAEEAEFSALVAQIVGGENVHLFEPAPWSWPNMRALWDANDLDGPGGWWPGFVSDTHEPDVYVEVGWPPCSLGPIRADSAFVVYQERPDIPSITIDEYALQEMSRPDVIMVDVEGAEHLVMRGACGVLMDARPLVFVSVHPDAWIERFKTDEGSPSSRAALFELMETVGYDATQIAVDHEEHWMFTSRPQ